MLRAPPRNRDRAAKQWLGPRTTRTIGVVVLGIWSAWSAVERIVCWAEKSHADIGTAVVALPRSADVEPGDGCAQVASEGLLGAVVERLILGPGLPGCPQLVDAHAQIAAHDAAVGQGLVGVRSPVRSCAQLGAPNRNRPWRGGRGEQLMLSVHAPHPYRVRSDGHAKPAARGQALHPQGATRSGDTSETERAPEPQGRVEADPGLRARRLRQDDAGGRVAGRDSLARTARGVALARP